MVRFENPTIGKKHVLVIAPHPDDAEIAAFAFYSAHHENAYVLTVTAGDFGPPNNYRFLEPDPQKAYLLKAKLRIFNSITTPLVGGVPPQRCLNLGYFDGTLYDMFKNPQKTFTSKGAGIADRDIYTSQNLSLLTASLTHQANWHNLVKDIRTVLEEIKPDIIVTPSPFDRCPPRPPVQYDSTFGSVGENGSQKRQTATLYQPSYPQRIVSLRSKRCHIPLASQLRCHPSVRWSLLLQPNAQRTADKGTRT